jgi:hypothetical protein
MDKVLLSVHDFLWELIRQNAAPDAELYQYAAKVSRRAAHAIYRFKQKNNPEY